jgi:hypothetical protein
MKLTVDLSAPTTGASLFASRASTHLRFCFLIIESVCPARVVDGPPTLGIMMAFSLVHMNAQSPSTYLLYLADRLKLRGFLPRLLLRRYCKGRPARHQYPGHRYN